MDDRTNDNEIIQDMPSTWDLGRCVICLVMCDKPIHSKPEHLKKRHYLRYLQNQCKRALLEKIAPSFDKVHPPSVRKKCLEQLHENIFSTICDACGARVLGGHDCQCQVQHKGKP